MGTSRFKTEKQKFTIGEKSMGEITVSETKQSSKINLVSGILYVPHHSDSNIGVGGSLRKRILQRGLPFKIKLERRPLGPLIDIEVHGFDATISRYDFTRADVFGKVTRLALFRKESRRTYPSGWILGPWLSVEARCSGSSC